MPDEPDAVVHVVADAPAVETPPAAVVVPAPAHDHTETILEHHAHLERHDHELRELRDELFSRLPGATVSEVNEIVEDAIEEVREEVEQEAEATAPEPEPEPEPEHDEKPAREHPFFRKLT